MEHKPQAVLRNIKGRSVTLDLKCTDENGVIFGVEVQKRDNDNHQKRVCYNMANLDTAESEKGVKFDELKDVYEIYISKFDVFGKNKTVYHIDRIIQSFRSCAKHLRISKQEWGMVLCVIWFKLMQESR